MAGKSENVTKSSPKSPAAKLETPDVVETLTIPSGEAPADPEKEAPVPTEQPLQFTADRRVYSSKMKLGENGGSVWNVALALALRGFLKTGVHANFDNSLCNAVAVFQLHYGMLPSGFPDEKVVKLLDLVWVENVAS